MAILKFLLIFFLSMWLISRIAGFLIRTFLGKVVNQARQNQSFQGAQQSTRRKPSDGNVNIDHVPNSQKTGKGTQGYDGGDYIDYEEVK